MHRRQVESAATEQIQSAKRRLRAQTRELETMGAGLAKTWSSLEAHGLDREAMLQAALPLLRRPTLLTNLLFCTTDGQSITLIREGTGWGLLQQGPDGSRFTPAFPTGLVKAFPAPVEPGFPHTRPWFIQGMKASQPQWTPTPYVFAGGQAEGYTYLVPVFNADGERRGLICLDITTDRLHQTLKRYLKPLEGQAMVTSPAHEVIMLPGEDAHPFPIQFQEGVPPTDKDFRPRGIVPTAWTSGPDFPRRIREGSQLFRVGRDNLTLAEGVDVILWTAIPLRGMPPILRGITLSFTALLILVTLAWVLYGMRITRRYGLPIMNLVDSAERARQGHEVRDVASDIWEIQKVGEQLQLVGQTVRAKQGLEDQLVRAQRFEVMSALSGGVIHDLNNLMTTIHLRVERAMDPTAPQPGTEIFEQIHHTTRQGCLMSRKLLDLGRGEPTIERLDLNDCVTEATLLLQPALQGTRLRISRADSELPIKGDSAEIAQVILNLALNARDAMDGRGELHLQTVRDDEGWPTLIVKDTGPGIPETLRGRMFEPYLTTKAKGKGTGLGLAVVRRVVERHRGKVQLDPDQGHGACFRLSFPPFGST
ncbi:MAG TPA: sensor histidine kinase [Holophagaceae bacterium]|nr:sensor histidine kinase [Holophagaceae bacterium]